MAIASTIPEPEAPSLTFLYHELRTHKSAYSYALEVEEFAGQLALFARLRQAGGSLWPRVSFDDGHLSDYELALPLLRERGMAAHFFITTGWTETPGYMGWAELRSLQAAGQRIGAHGWTHTLLTHCSQLQLKKELGDARRVLEDKLGCAIDSMSLPGGRYNRRVLDECWAAGYGQVYTSLPRAEAGVSGSLIGRLNMRSGMSLAALEELLAPGSVELARLGRQYRMKEAAQSLLGDALYARVWALVNKQERRTETGLTAAP